mmetsp:Transcript_11684/g.18751  ORF Transcript_11684/g.18751 Transcript_11684/m.18751 type:complete len:245 (-) Transcript_11684:1880-2614(-)
MSSRKPSSSNIVQVGYQYFVVYKRSHRSWSHVVNTIQIRHIHGSFVGRRILFVVLVDIKTKKYNINAIQILKYYETLAPVSEFFWVVLKSVAFLHAFPDFEFPVHRSYLADGDSSSHVNRFLRLFQSHSFLLYLFLGELFQMLVHFCSHMILDKLRELGPLEIFRHRGRRSCFWPARFFTLFDSTSWAGILGTLIFVLTSVEKRTYLMNPSFTSITLDPALFVGFVILLLHELFLSNRDVAKLN